MFSSLLFFLSFESYFAAKAFQPDEHIWIGIEPVRHLSYHTGQQHRLRSHPQWKQFIDATGWNIRFDEKTRLINRAMGAGIDLEKTGDAYAVRDSVQRFLQSKKFFAQKSIHLDSGIAIKNPDRNIWYVNFEQQLSARMQDDVYQRQINEVVVWRGGITGYVHSDRLTLIEANLYPDVSFEDAVLLSSEAIAVAISAGAAPEADHGDIEVSAVALPVEKNGQLSVRLCWLVKSKTESPIGHWNAFVDAHSGELHNVYNEVRFLEGSILATHDARTIGSELINTPLINLKVSDGGFSDENGLFSIEDDSYTITMNGKNTRISNDAGDDISFELVEGEQILTAEGDESLSQIDQFVFQNEIYTWAKEYAPHVVNEWSRSVVNVNLDDVCNAYFDGTLNFYRAGEGCNNTGRIRDVSHHEWGHGFHYYNLLSGDYDGSMSEGIADALAFFQSGDSTIAPGFGQNGYGIREVSENRVYPEDIVNEVHTDGLIFAGTVWDLWDRLDSDYGDSDAAFDALMPIFVDALRSGPSIPNSYEAFLLADDDNGDLSDGTPHECALVDVFGQHGLGPSGDGGFFQLSHIPLENQTVDTEEYTVDADVLVFSENCVDSTPDKAKIQYSLDDGETWQEKTLERTNAGISGFLASQERGSVVSYFLEILDSEGRSIQLPEYGTINPFSFYVGELEEINCEDFEESDGGFVHELVSGREQEGADDWMWGIPVGLGGDPNYAASGTKVWGNDLGGEHNGESYNGEYQNDKHNRLTTPDYDVSNYDEVLLVYKRWLHVEDGFYDNANVLANGTSIWSNHATRYEVGEEHHRDQQWQQHVLRIPAAELETMNFSWEIVSDAGLTMGGWTLDDVCLYGIPPAPEEPVASGCACSSQGEIRSSWMVFLLAIVGFAIRRRNG